MSDVLVHNISDCSQTATNLFEWIRKGKVFQVSLYWIGKEFHTDIRVCNSAPMKSLWGRFPFFTGMEMQVRKLQFNVSWEAIHAHLWDISPPHLALRYSGLVPSVWRFEWCRSLKLSCGLTIHYWSNSIFLGKPTTPVYIWRSYLQSVAKHCWGRSNRNSEILISHSNPIPGVGMWWEVDEVM